MSSFTIRPFAPGDAAGVAAVILPIQQEEFGIPITLEEQPDLRDIANFYQQKRGNFWVAEVQGQIVGTIGLLDIGNGQSALRKMFVAEQHRGRHHGVANSLLATLVARSRAQRFVEIYLGTTDKFRAAHRFYEKNDFQAIAKADLPPTFPVMAVDSKFYCRALP